MFAAQKAVEAKKVEGADVAKIDRQKEQEEQASVLSAQTRLFEHLFKQVEFEDTELVASSWEETLTAKEFLAESTFWKNRIGDKTV